MLYIFQDKILFQPTVLDKDFEYEFTHSFEELFIETDKNAIINAVHFKIDNPKGVILYFHGNQGNIQRWGVITEYFVDKGYNVLVMDYRSYGKSVGKLSENALYSDANHIYNYLKKEYQEKDIVVYGRSLGTTFATYVASVNKPRQLILETPYYSIVDVAKGRFPLVPVKHFMNYEFPTYKFINDVDCNITILHGTADKVVPFSSGQKLHRTITNPSTQFITIDNANHNNLIEFDAYHQEINSIL